MPADGNFRFIPAPDFDALAAGERRKVTFACTVNDGARGSAAAGTITVTVNGVNGADGLIIDACAVREDAPQTVDMAEGGVASHGDVRVEATGAHATVAAGEPFDTSCNPVCDTGYSIDGTAFASVGIDIIA